MSPICPPFPGGRLFTATPHNGQQREYVLMQLHLYATLETGRNRKSPSLSHFGHEKIILHRSQRRETSSLDGHFRNRQQSQVSHQPVGAFSRQKIDEMRQERCRLDVIYTELERDVQCQTGKQVRLLWIDAIVIGSNLSPFLGCLLRSFFLKHSGIYYTFVLCQLLLERDPSSSSRSASRPPRRSSSS